MAAANDGSVRARLIERLSGDRATLHVGGLDCGELARRFGTPLYVYDAGILRAQAAAVQAAFGPRVELLYALKANPSVAVARVLRRAGTGVELASAGEIHIAHAAGHAGGQMQFAGPAKSTVDLDTALAFGVGTVNLESAAEHARLVERARRRNTRPGVAIRVNPSRTTSGARVRMGGGSKKFGVDEDGVVALAQAIVREGTCKLHGLHVYAGSQSLDAQAWATTARNLQALGLEVERALRQPLASLNLGGGFGIPCFDADPVFDLAKAGAEVRALVHAARPEQRFHIELGRYLVAEAGVYLTRVLETKRSGGKDFALVDGGLHHFGAAAGLGAVIRRPYPIVACATPHATATAPWSLAGPLCTPADEFGTDVALPPLHAGDLVAVLVAGAYGLTFSPTAFLSHPLPAEVVVDAGEAILARVRGAPEDALRGQAQAP